MKVTNMSSQLISLHKKLNDIDYLSIRNLRLKSKNSYFTIQKSLRKKRSKRENIHWRRLAPIQGLIYFLQLYGFSSKTVQKQNKTDTNKKQKNASK